MKIAHFLLTTLSIAVISCSRNSEKPHAISVSSGVNDEAHINLSSIASSVEYIKLNTPEEVHMSQNIKVRFSDSYILCLDNKTENVFLFNEKGTFVRTISRHGNGPKEYAELSDVAIDQENQRIFILDAVRKQILMFDLEGKYIKTLKIANNPQDIRVLKEKKLLTYNAPAGADLVEHPHIRVIDYEGHIVGESYLPEVVKNGTFGRRTPSFYSYKDTLSLWQSTSDSVLALGSAGIIKPRYFFEDEHLLPAKKRFDEGVLLNKSTSYLDIDRLMETNHYLFIEGLYQSTRRCLLYDKKTKLSKNVVYNYEFYDNGFANDIDGGMPFWPSGQINENKLYAVHLPWRFLKTCDNEFTKAIKYKDESAHQQFESFVSQVSFSDNPIIQIVNLKK